MTKRPKNWKLPEATGTIKGLDNYPGWFNRLLKGRGLNTKEEAALFLNPNYEDLPSPNKFLEIKEAVLRLKEAKEKDEKITVYGDYDVDGVTATALVYDLLRHLGIKKENIETYIPHREDEGYGLNEEALAVIKKSGTTLVFSVDCGITSSDLIDGAAGDGLDFLVCDHHEIMADKVPKKAIIVHPERVTKGETPEKLSAAGMAFFLAMAMQDDSEIMADFPKGQEKWLLDLAALSTIADVMPLVGTNRVITKFGLTVLSKTKRPGIRELAKVASVDPRDISSYAVGFLLAPRLNAAGRLEHARTALDLLTTRDDKEARSLAAELNSLNGERQQLCERILTEAKAEIEEGDKGSHEIFLLSNKNWPRGVVGIIAGRLAETYARPVIVFEHDGGAYHGSARSVGDFDITAALAECEDCLIRFGGHAKAAGLTVSDEKFVVFSDKMLEITKNKIKESDLTPEIRIDTIIGSEEINDESLDLITLLEPYGYGNPTPVFQISGVEIENVKKVGTDQNHLKFKIKDTDLSGIYFSFTEELKENEKYDLAVQLRYNEWNNRKSIELRVIEAKRAE